MHKQTLPKAWLEIIEISDCVFLMAEEKKWDDISSLSDTLNEKVINFFDYEIASLEENEKSNIKMQGEILMRRLSEIYKLAEADRGRVMAESAKFARGKKGIQAYKRT